MESSDGDNNVLCPHIESMKQFVLMCICLACKRVVWHYLIHVFASRGPSNRLECNHLLYAAVAMACMETKSIQTLIELCLLFQTVSGDPKTTKGCRLAFLS
eukprot:2247540-Amphidinium_carterae.1